MDTMGLKCEACTKHTAGCELLFATLGEPFNTSVAQGSKLNTFQACTEIADPETLMHIFSPSLQSASKRSPIYYGYLKSGPGPGPGHKKILKVSARPLQTPSVLPPSLPPSRGRLWSSSSACCARRPPPASPGPSVLPQSLGRDGRVALRPSKQQQCARQTSQAGFFVVQGIQKGWWKGFKDMGTYSYMPMLCLDSWCLVSWTKLLLCV